MSILIALALQSAAAASPAPVIPQPDVSRSGRIERGMPIVDMTGSPVGNVSSVTAETLVVDTGTRKVAFATSDFQMLSGGLLFGLTRAEVDSAGIELEQKFEMSRASLRKVGTQVVGADGGPIGRVQSVEPGFMTLSLLPTGVVRLPDHSFAGSDGRLVIAMTLPQLKQLIASR